MIETDLLLTFFGSSILLALAPGPDNIFVLTQSMTQGHRAGILVTLGLCTGLLFHTTAVALGVATLLQSSTLAFLVLKTIGAGYLLFLAYKAFRSRKIDLSHRATEVSLGKNLFLRGVLMNSTNPKVSLFFLAFLPQFITPAQGSVPQQVFTLGATFLLAAFIVFSSISLMAARVGAVLVNNKRIEPILNKIVGTVFVLLALKLLSSEM